MKRLVIAVAAVCAAAALAVAAPAVSLSPYRPEPVDFELAAPAAGAAKAANGTLVSPPLRAPRRFNLVGLRWRGRAEPRVALRVRRAGARWTRWARVAAETHDGPDPGTAEARKGLASAPAWAGDADEVQYRISRRVPGLRVHFVNVHGTSTRADRLRTALRRATAAAVAPLGRLVGGQAARAQGTPPPMVTRDGWGAEDCPPRTGADYGEVKAAHIHHTVSLNDYTREEARSVVLSICRYHRNSNKWNDIGYNFLVDKYGTLYEGRAGGIDQPVQGAQAQGYNTQTTGIANIGTHSDVPQSQEALRAMAALIRWKLPLHGAPTAGAVELKSGGGDTNRYSSGRTVTVDRVIGHRDTNKTECPGESLYAQLTELRRLVGDLSPSPVLKDPDSRARTAVAAGVAPRAVGFGRRVRVSGRLRRAGGRRLSRKRVEVQTLRGRRWRTAKRLRTGSRGQFTTLLRSTVTRLLRVRFRGDGTLRGSTSKRVQLVVLPVVGLSRAPARGAAGVRVPLVGTVKPAKRQLVLIVQLRRRGRWQKPGLKAVRPRNGRFRTWFRPGRRGLWRFSVATIADRSHGRGRSRVYTLRAGRFSGGAVAGRAGP